MERCVEDDEKTMKKEEWCEKRSGKEITLVLAIETLDLLEKI